MLISLVLRQRNSFSSHGYEIPVDLCFNGIYIIQSIVNLLKKVYTDSENTSA